VLLAHGVMGLRLVMASRQPSGSERASTCVFVGVWAAGS
jgi:hypothetical protein